LQLTGREKFTFLRVITTTKAVCSNHAYLEPFETDDAYVGLLKTNIGYFSRLGDYLKDFDPNLAKSYQERCRQTAAVSRDRR
jgi:hypothetical protein